MLCFALVASSTMHSDNIFELYLRKIQISKFNQYHRYLTYFIFTQDIIKNACLTFGKFASLHVGTDNGRSQLVDVFQFSAHGSLIRLSVITLLHCFQNLERKMVTQNC